MIDESLEIIETRGIKQDELLLRLEDQINFVTSNSRFYQEKYKNIISRSIQKLPFTEKSEIITDQVTNPPFGSNVCVNKTHIQRIHRTSGTTARPVYIPMSKKDIETSIKIGRRCFWSAGLRSSDTVVHCLNYCMWSGGYTDHQSLEATGAAVVPYGVGNSTGLIDVIQELGINAIHCTPSYLPVLEQILTEKNILPKDLGLRKGLFGGESGIQNSSVKRKIKETWGMTAMNANYGLSEVLSMFGSECYEQVGIHFMAHESIYPELINPKTTELLQIKPGVRGELVLTNIEKEAFPLIRYRTHDIIEIVGNDCACSRIGFRFKILGRSDDMIVVKGINLFPQAIGDILANFPELTGEYEICIENKDPIDKIIVRVGSHIESSKLTQDIEHLISQKLNIPSMVRIAGKIIKSDTNKSKIIRVIS